MRKALLVLGVILSVAGSGLAEEKLSSNKKAASEVTRKTTQSYFNGSPKERVFYFDGKEIARRTYDESGKIIASDKIPDGIVTEYYDNGNLKLLITYKNNRGNGLYKDYYENGNIRIEQNLSDDRFNGERRVYYPDGKISEITYWNYGVKIGSEPKDSDKFKNILKSAEVASEKIEKKEVDLIQMKDISAESKEDVGELLGVIRIVTQRYPNEDAREIVYKKNGIEVAKEIRDEKGASNVTGKIPDGIVKEYYESGELKSEFNYRDNKREGFKKSFFKSGKLESQHIFVNNIVQGTSKLYYENGILRQETSYKDDKIDGKVKVYFEDGKINEELSYNQDKLEGASKVYFANGSVKLERMYKNGKLEGVLKGFYESGKILDIWNFKDGEAEGIVKSYYESGELEHEWIFKDGKQEGLNKTYFKNGKIKEITYYLKGIVREKTEEEIISEIVDSLKQYRAANLNYIIMKNSLNRLTQSIDLERKGKEVAKYAEEDFAPTIERFSSLINKYAEKYGADKLRRIAILYNFLDLLG